MKMRQHRHGKICHLSVLAGLDPAIHDFTDELENVDPRVKPGGDGEM